MLRHAKSPLISLVLVFPNDDDDVECIEFISRIVTSERTYMDMDGKS